MSAAERKPVNRADLSEGDRVTVSYTASTHEYQHRAIEGTVSEVELNDFSDTVRFVYVRSEIGELYRIQYGGSLQVKDDRLGWVSEGYLAQIERASHLKAKPAGDSGGAD